MATIVNSTLSLFNNRLTSLLNTIAPQWRSYPLTCDALSAETRLALKACGIKTLGDLEQLTPLALLALAATADLSLAGEQPFWISVRHAGYAAIAPILFELIGEQTMVTHAQWAELRHAEPESLSDVSIESLLNELICRTFTGTAPLATLFTVPREMEVLFARWGVHDGQPRSLGEIGAALHLTRERVRQLQKRAETLLQRPYIRPLINSLATLVTRAVWGEGGATTVARTAARIATWVPFGSLYPAATTVLLATWAPDISSMYPDWLIVAPFTPALVQQIEQIIQQVLEAYPRGLSINHLVDEILRAGSEKLCAADKRFIAAVLRVSHLLDIQDDYCRPRWQGKMKAWLINALQSLGRPAHFAEITEYVHERFREAGSYSASRVHVCLLSYPQTFVRVGDGIYALAECSYQAEQTIIATIQQLLNNSNRPLHRSEIIALARRCYRWSEQSLIAGLYAHPQIRIFDCGFFGLADRVYTDFDPAQVYDRLFDTSRAIKRGRIVRICRNKRNNRVVQLKLSSTTVKGLIQLNKVLRELLPFAGNYQAEALCPGQPARELTINCSYYDLTGLRGWFADIQAQPGDYLFIEKLADEQRETGYTYRFAYAPQDKLADAMQAIGLI